MWVWKNDSGMSLDPPGGGAFPGQEGCIESSLVMQKNIQKNKYYYKNNTDLLVILHLKLKYEEFVTFALHSKQVMPFGFNKDVEWYTNCIYFLLTKHENPHIMQNSTSCILVSELLMLKSSSLLCLFSQMVCDKA